LLLAVVKEVTEDVGEGRERGGFGLEQTVIVQEERARVRAERPESSKGREEATLLRLVRLRFDSNLERVLLRVISFDVHSKKDIAVLRLGLGLDGRDCEYTKAKEHTDEGRRTHCERAPMV
jgi:hypothetical protein